MTIDSILCAGTCAIQLPQTGAEDGGASESPVASSYDVIMGFSVVTHLAPPDTAHLFRLTRKVVRPEGFLFSPLSVTIPSKFRRSRAEKPLLKAYYNKSYLEDLIREAGWNWVPYETPAGYIMNFLFVPPQFQDPSYQVVHKGLFFFQFSNRRVDFAAAEIADRQLLHDLPFAASHTDRK